MVRTEASSGMAAIFVAIAAVKSVVLTLWREATAAAACAGASEPASAKRS